MGTKTSRLLVGVVLLSSALIARGQDEDGYLGVLNANEAFIDSISNESGTRTGDFSTQSLLSSVAVNAQWALDGPVVVSTSGEILGTLSTVDVDTRSLFNEAVYIQVPFIDRCEACIGSLNNNFSTEGPKIYDSQSEVLKSMISERIFEDETKPQLTPER